jgi:hypothetical protein
MWLVRTLAATDPDEFAANETLAAQRNHALGRGV